MKLASRIRRDANAAIHPLTVGLRDAIPLGDCFARLVDLGLHPVDEAGDPWQGILCGSDGRATFALATDDGEEIDNAVLAVMWHRMEVSGRYEFTAYVS